MQPTRESLRGTALISDDQADDALHSLLDNAREVALARGAVVRCEAMLKHVKAIYTLRSNMTSFTAKEAEAMASHAYRQAIDDHADAVVAFEELKAKRENCIMTIEMWRSAQANLRAARI
jgi:hypothetical protein